MTFKLYKLLIITLLLLLIIYNIQPIYGQYNLIQSFSNPSSNPSPNSIEFGLHSCISQTGLYLLISFHNFNQIATKQGKVDIYEFDEINSQYILIQSIEDDWPNSSNFDEFSLSISGCRFNELNSGSTQLFIGSKGKGVFMFTKSSSTFTFTTHFDPDDVINFEADVSFPLDSEFGSVLDFRNDLLIVGDKSATHGTDLDAGIIVIYESGLSLGGPAIWDILDIKFGDSLGGRVAIGGSAISAVVVATFGNTDGDVDDSLRIFRRSGNTFNLVNEVTASLPISNLRFINHNLLFPTCLYSTPTASNGNGDIKILDYDSDESNYALTSTFITDTNEENSLPSAATTFSGFGTSFFVSTTNDLAFIGSPITGSLSEGRVFIFRWNSNTNRWSFIGDPISTNEVDPPEDDGFGRHVFCSSDLTTCLSYSERSNFAGAVFIYKIDSSFFDSLNDDSPLSDDSLISLPLAVGFGVGVSLGIAIYIGYQAKYNNNNDDENGNNYEKQVTTTTATTTTKDNENLTAYDRSTKKMQSSTIMTPIRKASTVSKSKKNRSNSKTTHTKEKTKTKTKEKTKEKSSKGYQTTPVTEFGLGSVSPSKTRSIHSSQAPYFG